MNGSIPVSLYKKLRDMLTESRRQAGMTQNELAIALGKPQSYVSKYETGERGINVLEFLQIAKILGINVSEFMQILIDEMGGAT
ncbi:MAG TPA: helix-turn-helix transcriptional regulator [Herpetosiphonaceae bacterium]